MNEVIDLTKKSDEDIIEGLYKVALDTKKDREEFEKSEKLAALYVKKYFEKEELDEKEE
ncbi:MAG: hypothetical protein ACI4WW_05325 [Candidatus Coprovivens sp.]